MVNHYSVCMKIFGQKLKMSFVWSEKEKRFTMFEEDDKEDINDKFDTKKKKKPEKRGDLLGGKLGKDIKKKGKMDCKNNK